jgi:NifB/MoaA-like Fe-S oxidoreductase
VPLGGNIVEHLRRLSDAAIEVHTQIVLCPEWNDGAALDRTIDDLWDIGPNVLSLSVVPVGLTRYNINRPIRLQTPAEAKRAIEQVNAARERAFRERGIGWAYAADEMFFIAGEPQPPASYYDDWPLMENGVGSVRRLLDDFHDGVKELKPSKYGRIGIVTGKRMEPVFQKLAPRLAAALKNEVQVVGVTNDYFGETVTTAGLLPGGDIGAAIADEEPFDLVLIPGEALNDDERFIDNVALSALCERFPATRIVPAFEITSALRAL